MEEGQGPFPSWEGKRSVGISQRQKERSTLEEGLIMAKWSVRKRKGFGTPSLEEFLWYHMLPGGIYKTAQSGSTESEEFDYYVGSGLVWFGSMAYALDAMAAAQALGTTNIAAEFAVYRNLSYLRMAGHAAPFVASSAAGAYVGVQLVEESGVIPQTIEIYQGRPSKPWWMPLAVYHAMYS